MAATVGSVLTSCHKIVIRPKTRSISTYSIHKLWTPQTGSQLLSVQSKKHAIGARTPENRRGGLFYGPGKSSDAKSGGPGEKFGLELTSHKRPEFVRTGAKSVNFSQVPHTRKTRPLEYVGTVIKCQTVQIHNEKDDIGIAIVF